MELVTAFREIKDVLHCPQETPKKKKNEKDAWLH